MQPRAQHLEWCKKRALAYVDQGYLQQALSSMISDLMKHPKTAKPHFTHPKKVSTEIDYQDFSDEEIRLAIAVAKRVEQGKERVFTLEESMADLGLWAGWRLET